MNHTSLLALSILATLGASSARAAGPEIGKDTPLLQPPADGHCAGRQCVRRCHGHPRTRQVLHVLHRRRRMDLGRLAPLVLPACRQCPGCTARRQIQRQLLHVRQRWPALQGGQPPRALHQSRAMEEHARRGRWMERPLRHGHLHRRRQQALSLLPRPRNQRHLRRAARPQRPHEVRRPAQASLRIQQGPRLGTLRRDERVHGRGVDRRPLAPEDTTAPTICNTPPPAPSGRPMPRDTTPRSRRWARSPTPPTTRCSARPTASSPVPRTAASWKDPTGISGSSTPSSSRTRPADAASEWIASPSTRTATWP